MVEEGADDGNRRGGRVEKEKFYNVLYVIGYINTPSYLHC